MHSMRRTVVGALGMSAETKKYYQKLCTKVLNSGEWQGYRKKKALVGPALFDDELMSYKKNKRKIHRKMLIKMGAIKSSFQLKLSAPSKLGGAEILVARQLLFKKRQNANKHEFAAGSVELPISFLPDFAGHKAVG